MKPNPIPMLLTLAAALACTGAHRSAYPARSGLDGAVVADARPAASPQANADGPRIVCGLERPTGSNIMRRVCRSQEQVERDRDAAQTLLTNPHAAGRP